MEQDKSSVLDEDYSPFQKPTFNSARQNSEDNDENHSNSFFLNRNLFVYLIFIRNFICMKTHFVILFNKL